MGFIQYFDMKDSVFKENLTFFPSVRSKGLRPENQKAVAGLAVPVGQKHQARLRMKVPLSIFSFSDSTCTPHFFFHAPFYGSDPKLPLFLELTYSDGVSCNFIHTGHPLWLKAFLFSFLLNFRTTSNRIHFLLF
jgi:hypothetical protein